MTYSRKRVCLIVNNREPIREDFLADLEPLLDTRWHQFPEEDFSLQDAIKGNPDTEILVTTYMDWSATNLAMLPRLSAIIATTVAVEYIDREYCRAQGIAVYNTPGYSGASVAEFAVAMLLSTAKRIVSNDRAARAGPAMDPSQLGMELAGKRAGVVGLGNIGTRVTRMLLGFDMEVVFHNRSEKTFRGARSVALDTLVSTSDAVILTLPLNHDSRHLIGTAEIAKMKKGALLVSVSPDDIVDLDALTAALSGNRLFAALDLHRPHPELSTVSNLVLSHRKAWYTAECFSRRIATWKRTLHGHVTGATAGHA